MCASIGVDPLASSKGFWSEMLGVGDFYYELGVQIVEVCMASSHRDEMSTLILRSLYDIDIRFYMLFERISVKAHRNP